MLRVDQLPGASAETGALDSRNLRVLTWNIHKQSDIGWERDLARLVAGTDVALLQEVELQSRIRSVVEGAQLQWTLASSFEFVDDDVGVMIASRVAPLRSCMQRTTEPLIRIPKSVVIAWFQLAGVSQTLAVVNIHAINFSLSLDSYRAQLDAIEKTLAGHRGPIVFAGDLNTWSEGRMQAVREITERLGLASISLRDDRRSLFFGKPFDYVFIRGLEIVDASAIPVTSSDHNPIAVTLRVTGP